MSALNVCLGTKPTKEKKKNILKDLEGKSVAEMKIELQKVMIDIQTGKEKNTSLIKKIKREIARNLTKSNVK